MIRVSTLLALLITTSLQASSVFKYDAAKHQVSLKNVNATVLSVNGDVCLFAGTATLGCGKVLVLADNAALVQMQTVNHQIVVGSEVAIRPKGRAVSSTAEVSENFNQSNKERSLGFALGLSAGFNYFYPNMHIQLAIGRQWTLGLMPMFASYKNSTSSVTAYGGYLTASYYHTHSALKGLEFEGGVGAFNIGASTSNQTALGGKFTVGWRGRALWDLGLDLGVAAGVQYIGYNSNLIAISFSGFLPLINAYIGYSL